MPTPRSRTLSRLGLTRPLGAGPSMPVLALFAGTLAMAACSPSQGDDTPEQNAAQSDDQSDDQSGNNSAGEHPPSDEARSDAPADEQANAPGSATAPNGLPAPDPETPTVQGPPSLPSLMRRIGFLEADSADLTEFAHLPPGAEGQAGAFGEGERVVRVASIAYPNARYVAPHFTDVRERIRVLPNPREAALAHDRWIIHIMARDLATANEVRDRLAETLDWSVD